jgi:hypothetical protein
LFVIVVGRNFQCLLTSFFFKKQAEKKIFFLGFFGKMNSLDQTIKLGLLSTTVLFGVIFLGLTAASRAGDGLFNFPSGANVSKHVYQALDTLAAFGILGALLSMFTGGIGIYLALTGAARKSLFGRIWTVCALISVFFLACAFGVYAELEHNVLAPNDASLELACLAFNVLLLLAWIAVIIYFFYSDSGEQQASASYDQVDDGDAEQAGYGGGYGASSYGVASGSSLGRIDIGMGSSFDLSSAVLSIGAVFCLIAVALAGANKDGDDHNLETSDTHAGLAITGALIGMMTCVGGVLLRLLNIESPMVNLAWMGSTLLAFWFLAAPFGGFATGNYWIVTYKFSLFQAEMAFEFLSCLLLSLGLMLRVD